MYTTQISNQPSASPFNWTSLLQLIFSALAAFFLLGVAVLIALSSMMQFFTQGSGNQDLTQSFMIASSLAFVGVLILPSAWYAWKNISSPEPDRSIIKEPQGFGLILTMLVLVVIPGSLWLGNLVSQNDQLAWFILPFLNIIVNGLAALWLIYIGIRGLNLGSPRRVWGIFSTGLIVSPVIILVVELFALVGFGILAILWGSVTPEISNQFQVLIFHLQNAAPNPEAILHILMPVLLKPGILFLVFSFISVIVPIIEETIKPTGLWFLAGKKINPAQGFAYGVLCGAGFGLFENLGNTSAGGETWVILASTRITTLLLHCLTTGLVGWALASAWSEKRYLRLGITYAFAIIVHGLWNGMAVLSAISSLEGQVNIKLPANLPQIGSLATIGIIVLGAINLILYISFNAGLRNSTYSGASPLAGGGVNPTLTISESIATVQSESNNSATMAVNPIPLVNQPVPPSSEKQFLPDTDTHSTNPELHL
jgi:PrsW family intramembrane metalloprotease